MKKVMPKTKGKPKKEEPIARVEKMLKELHDKVGKYTQPVLRRYPLLFAFLIIFSAAAILHGFELVVEQTNFFKNHPSYLISIGIFSLFLTGMLYKTLDKIK